jgi:urease subunit alpha
VQAVHLDGSSQRGPRTTVSRTLARSAHPATRITAEAPCRPTGLVREPNVVCSSTTPTIPYGPATAAEHLEMILAVHGGSADAPEDVEAARERIHPATMAAEGPLHDLGAISIVNSDSQGMGRIGETIRRTWQLAHVMKAFAGESADDDNDRVLRYLAKYTLEPARTHGIEREVGSPRAGTSRRHGSLASEPLRREAGADPEGGSLRVGGDRRGERDGRGKWAGSIRSTLGSAGYGSTGAVDDLRVEGCAWGRDPGRIGSRRRFVAVENTRTVRRDTLAWNRVVPPIEVDPHDGTVTLDGRVLAVEPARDIPLGRKYMLG